MKKFKVCVADDNEESSSILCHGLRMHGYEAVTATNGTQAVEMCAEEEVDLILLDVCMPEIDGYEVCRRLKANPATEHIVVIFVTVKGSQEDIAKGFQLGAVDYITKPYNLPMVMVRVDAAISRQQAMHALQQSQDMLIDTAYTDSLTGLRNRRYLLERLQEEVEKSHRYVFPVSCLVFDLDDIKAEDDELGPASLDDLLVEVAMVLRHHTRSYDILARYEGTMFTCILPHTPLEQARSYAQKILEEMDSTTFSDPCFPTTAKMAVGITCCKNGVAYGAEYVLGEAMRGLLQAKTQKEERVMARNLDEEAE